MWTAKENLSTHINIQIDVKLSNIKGRENLVGHIYNYVAREQRTEKIQITWANW